MNYAAIDFETANAKRSSACSVGLSIVQNGKIEESYDWLISPVPFEFNPFNTSIHGLTEKDVSDAPEFADVWHEIDKIRGSLPLVAHNAAFDMSVIRHALEITETPYPNADYLCTLLLARHALPHSGSYRLNFLCEVFDIELDHHDARSDAIACAKLLLILSKKLGVSSISMLDEIITFGELYYDGYRPSSLVTAHKTGPSNLVTAHKARPNMTNAELNALECLEPNEEFQDKYFSFTGTLKSMKRNLAKELVVRSGGKVQSTTTLSTNYLVTGIQNTSLLKGKVSSKLKRAMTLADEGQDIQIIEEDMFLEMLDPDIYESVLNEE